MLGCRHGWPRTTDTMDWPADQFRIVQVLQVLPAPSRSAQDLLYAYSDEHQVLFSMACDQAWYLASVRNGQHGFFRGGKTPSKLWPVYDMGMDQYLLIPCLGGWTSIYQLFWCSPGVQGFDTLPYMDWHNDQPVESVDFGIPYFQTNLIHSCSRLVFIHLKVSDKSWGYP